MSFDRGTHAVGKQFQGNFITVSLNSNSKPTARARPLVWLFIPAIPLLMHQHAVATGGDLPESAASDDEVPS